jgi:hypothetical protein
MNRNMKCGYCERPVSVECSRYEIFYFCMSCDSFNVVPAFLTWKDVDKAVDEAWEKNRG